MILFRADGNPAIGTGHVMRCLSIADALRKKGLESVFVCADHEAERLIDTFGYECFVLETEYQKMSEETDVLFGSRHYCEADLVVVDSYFATSDYLSKITENKKTVFMDDYFSFMPVSAVINYNIYANPLEYEKAYKEKLPRLILGPSYAPLREEFIDIDYPEIKEKAANILVLSGGSDPAHIAPALAKELVNEGLNDMKFHFVLGTMSDSAAELKEYEKECSCIVTHVNVKDMQQLMSKCDIAITAAGSTMYELCACGVPTINFAIADNQRLGAAAFAEKQIMLSLGMVTDVKEFSKRAVRETLSLAKDPIKRKEMSVKAKKEVDGRGAERIADKLEELLN